MQHSGQGSGTITFIYFFIGLFAANIIVGLATGRGSKIDFMKKEQDGSGVKKTWHEQDRYAGVNKQKPQYQGAYSSQTINPLEGQTMIMGSNAYTSTFVSPGYTSTIPGRALLTE